MTANVFIYLIVEVSKSSSQDKNGKGGVIIPKEKFWKLSSLPRAYWNREQEKLNRWYNPILNRVANQTGDLFTSPNTSHLNYCEPDSTVMTAVTDFNNLPDRFKDFLLYLRCRNKVPHSTFRQKASNSGILGPRDQCREPDSGKGLPVGQDTPRGQPP